MTLEQLRIFIAVAEREHMTAAAKAINVTQSAASAAIAALEERHGVKLFHRVGRGITLTEAGQAFLIEARNVVARATTAERLLSEFGNLSRGTLKLAVSQTIAAYWLPRILAQYRVRYQGIEIELTIANTQQAAARVRDGEADLGIVEGVVDDPVLASWRVGDDQLLIVQAEPFAGTAVSTEWIRSAHWVMREKGSGTRSTLNAALRRIGIDPQELNVTLELPSNESVRSAVEAGAGVAALSALVTAPAIQLGTLHALPLDLENRAFHALRHKERYRSKAADALLDIIAEQQPSDVGKGLS
ncbi:LysR family transcriptional regulator [Altererythrobacter indicus]|uniref:LysR family transcriptional regulator n=1 Tax=Altericroceibacterium indicum TaxID=374177 RepID=A0A845A5R9_9SPHN|nr:LysR substrate-binding domain-containing protein [Altericroceibacterium indicum]MXP25530.1 LysR family transcriptional regulator [Altericroceibacterium indicum]